MPYELRLGVYYTRSRLGTLRKTSGNSLGPLGPYIRFAWPKLLSWSAERQVIQTVVKGNLENYPYAFECTSLTDVLSGLCMVYVSGISGGKCTQWLCGPPGWAFKGLQQAGHFLMAPAKAAFETCPRHCAVPGGSLRRFVTRNSQELNRRG